MDITLKRIAEITSINISSIRYYKDLYFKYLTTSGEGRTMKYEEKSSVAIFTLVAESYKKRMVYEQIVELIEGAYGIPTVGNLEVKDNNTAIVQQDVITAIKEAFREEVKALEDKIDLLAVEARERDTQSQSRDELIMTNIRLIREQNYNKRSIWSRIFFK